MRINVVAMQLTTSNAHQTSNHSLSSEPTTCEAGRSLIGAGLWVLTPARTHECPGPKKIEVSSFGTMLRSEDAEYRLRCACPEQPGYC
jgi:hypothetical protein